MGAGFLPDVSEKRMFKDYSLQTTKGRALVALIVGAALGALVVAGFIAYEIKPHMVFRNAIQLVLAEYATSFMVWGFGIFLVGGPIWFVLHKTGLRTWPIALFIGFILPFALFFLIFTGQVSDILALQGSNDRLPFLTRPVLALRNLPVLDGGRAAMMSAIFGAVSSFIALTIWRIAYLRPPPC
jgi:hypothetical protein